MTPVEFVLTVFGALCSGGVLTAVVTSITGHRMRRVSEAETLSKIQTTMREEIRAENKKLEEKLDKVEKAVLDLTNLLDDVFPTISECLSDEQRTKLRVASMTARRAV